MKCGMLSHFCGIKGLAFLGHFPCWPGVFCKGIKLEGNSTSGGVGLTNSKNTNRNYLPGGGLGWRQRKLSSWCIESP